MAATQKNLLEAMKGQEFRIDGLRALFPPSTWPAGTQPDYLALKVVVDKYLEEYVLPVSLIALTFLLPCVLLLRAYSLVAAGLMLVHATIKYPPK
jgi:hypothetical protein